VPLFSDQVRLREPPLNLRVNLRRLVQPEYVYLVERRDEIDASKTWAFETASQHDMAVDPPAAQAEGGEAHSDLECDASLLGKDSQRS
jgi:hypothetical protein